MGQHASFSPYKSTTATYTEPEFGTGRGWSVAGQPLHVPEKEVDTSPFCLKLHEKPPQVGDQSCSQSVGYVQRG